MTLIEKISNSGMLALSRLNWATLENVYYGDIELNFRDPLSPMRFTKHLEVASL